MPRHKQPGSLVELSLVAIGQDLLMCGLQPCNLPRDLATRVTRHLLEAVAEYMTQEEEYLHNVPESVVRKLVCSAIYPGVSRLEMSSLPDVLCLALGAQLHSLGTLTTLKLPTVCTRSIKLELRDLVEQSFASLPNLVVFSYHKHCTDSVVAALSQHCPKLQHLTVPFSKNVTNESTNNILTLKNLRLLDIWGTFITREFCDRLLMGLAELETFCSDQDGFPYGHVLSVKSLVMTELDSPTLLSQTFPHLVQLNIFAACRNLASLSALTELRDLSIGKCYFSFIEALLASRGSSLTDLKLNEVIGVDLKFLCGCTQLRTLYLNACVYSVTVPSLDVSSPHFGSLEHLDVHKCNSASINLLLGAYSNLRRLYLSYVLVLDQDVIVGAAETCKLAHLEVVSFRECGHIQLDTFNALVGSCTNLRRVRYTGVDIPDDDEVDGFQHLEAHFKLNNLDIALVLE